MKTKTLSLPSFAASFLINGELSSINEQERNKIILFLSKNSISPHDCLSCSENSHIGKWSGQLCDMLEFTFSA